MKCLLTSKTGSDGAFCFSSCRSAVCCTKTTKNGPHFILRHDWRKIAAFKGFLVNLDEICRTDRNNC